MDKGITHIHERSSITPSCIDNDVHMGSQSVLFVPTLCQFSLAKGGQILLVLNDDALI